MCEELVVRGVVQETNWSELGHYARVQVEQSENIPDLFVCPQIDWPEQRWVDV